MYEQFHISPAFILKNPKGLWRELNYALGLMVNDDREAMIRLLEYGYDLVWNGIKN